MSVRALVLAWAVACVACAGASPELRPSSRDLVLPVVDDRAAFDDPRLRAALDQIAGCPERPGNAAELLVDHATVARRVANARGADVILAKTFQFGEDVVGREAAALLMERARAGAFVVLQYEPLINLEGGRKLPEMLRNTSAEQPLGELRMIRQLRDAGVIVVPTNSLTRFFEPREWAQNARRFASDPGAAIERTLDSLQVLDYHDHEKYWITGRRGADGRLELRAILGGSSLSSAYGFGGTRLVDPLTGDRGWRDTDVELRGPVVNDIVERFFDLMEYHHGLPVDPALRERMNPPQRPAGSARVRFVWNHPAIANLRAVEKAYRALIDATPRGGVVRIETAYFAPRGALRRALEDALRRGTRLTILTNSPASNNHATTSYAGRVVFASLLRIDPQVALLERAPRPDIGEVTLHSKIASFGTRGPVIVGSANFDGESQEHCTESIVIIQDPEFRRAFDEVFLRDIAADRVDRFTREDLRRVPFFGRVRDLALYHVAGYWL